MAYDGHKSRKGKARKRAEGAKRYLVRHGIEATHVRITADQDLVGPAKTEKMKF
jgi:hypothetical protein